LYLTYICSNNLTAVLTYYGAVQLELCDPHTSLTFLTFWAENWFAFYSWLGNDIHSHRYWFYAPCC